MLQDKDMSANNVKGSTLKFGSELYCYIFNNHKVSQKKKIQCVRNEHKKINKMEMRGIEPRTSRMQSERSTM